MKRSFIQACRTSGSVPAAKQRTAGKKVSPIHQSVSSGAVADVYERYYRDPVSALYQAVKKSR